MTRAVAGLGIGMAREILRQLNAPEVNSAMCVSGTSVRVSGRMQAKSDKAIF